MFEVVPTSTGAEAQAFSTWISQAGVEYRHLADTLSAIGAQLAALGATLQAAAPPQQASPPLPALSQVLAGAPAEALTEVEYRVSLLGRFRFEAAGRAMPTDIPGQIQTILKYLVSHRRRPTSKESLYELLWPEGDPQLASGRLRVLMHSLRKFTQGEAIGCRALILTANNSFFINPDVSLWVDTEEFERHWHAGWRYARAGYTQQAMDEYEHAERLYTGDFLEDEPYADWTLLRREALRDAYANVLASLANMSLQAGDYTGAIIWAQKQLAQDECREDAYRLLMTSYLRLGQPARAAYWHRLCTNTLQRELDLSPSSETEKIFTVSPRIDSFLPT